MTFVYYLYLRSLLLSRSDDCYRVYVCVGRQVDKIEIYNPGNMWINSLYYVHLVDPVNYPKRNFYVALILSTLSTLSTFTNVINFLSIGFVFAHYMSIMQYEYLSIPFMPLFTYFYSCRGGGGGGGGGGDFSSSAQNKIQTAQ